jgi:hypothetical protein
LTAHLAARPIFVSLCPVFSKAPDCAKTVRRRQVMEIKRYSGSVVVVLRYRHPACKRD